MPRRGEARNVVARSAPTATHSRDTYTPPHTRLAPVVGSEENRTSHPTTVMQLPPNCGSILALSGQLAYPFYTSQRGQMGVDRDEQALLAQTQEGLIGQLPELLLIHGQETMQGQRLAGQVPKASRPRPRAAARSRSSR